MFGSRRSCRLYQTPASTALVPLLAPMLHPGVVATSRDCARDPDSGFRYLTAALSSRCWWTRVHWSGSYARFFGYFRCSTRLDSLADLCDFRAACAYGLSVGSLRFAPGLSVVSASCLASRRQGSALETAATDPCSLWPFCCLCALAHLLALLRLTLFLMQGCATAAPFWLCSSSFLLFW